MVVIHVPYSGARVVGTNTNSIYYLMVPLQLYYNHPQNPILIVKAPILRPKPCDGARGRGQVGVSSPDEPVFIGCARLRLQGLQGLGFLSPKHFFKPLNPKPETPARLLCAARSVGGCRRLLDKDGKRCFDARTRTRRPGFISQQGVRPFAVLRV